MPVFDNFKKLSMSKNDAQNEYKFNSWSDNLKVILKPNTAVLNIRYQDYDKDRVLLVLNQISKNI